MNESVKIRTAWRILLFSLYIFNRYFGYFLIFSILPLLSLAAISYYFIENTGWGGWLVAILIGFMYVYGVTLLIAWDLIWRGKANLREIVLYLVHNSIRFIITLSICLSLILILPLLSIILFYKSIKFLFGSEIMGLRFLLILFCLIILSGILIITQMYVFSGLMAVFFLFSLLIFSTVILSPYIMNFITLPINLFERATIIKSFTRSISLTWGHYLHILPYYLLKTISLFLIITASYLISFYLSDLLFIPKEKLFTISALGLYLITIPYSILFRVCYYMDLVLRKEGFESLKKIREIYCRYFDEPGEVYYRELTYPTGEKL